MTPEQHQKLQEHVSEIAKLLYADAQAQELPMANLSEIEMTVRSQLLRRVSPEVGIFLSKRWSAQTQATDEG